MPALLASFDIPSELHAVIGNFTPKLFGLVATDLTDLNRFLASLELASCSEDEFVVRAKIRRLWQHCSAPEVPAENPAVNATQPLSTTSSTSTWAETFPPKLDAAVVRSFRDRFEKSYPSEILDSESMPSSRLLALAHRYVKNKEWQWIPWAWRMSQAQLDASQLQRPSKLPKLDNLFVDEVPVRDLPHGNNPASEGILRSVLSIHSNAIALVEGAHLGVLRLYEKRFLKLALQRFENGSGLRSVNVQEAMNADRRAWEVIGDLLAHGWQLDDAISEVVEVRNELSSMLQARPWIPKFEPSRGKGGFKGKPPGKPKGKGRGFGLKEAFSGKERTPWATEIVRNSEVQKICVQYNLPSGCQRPACKFLHVCCVAKQDGAPCGGKHSATQHRATPH